MRLRTGRLAVMERQRFTMSKSKRSAVASATLVSQCIAASAETLRLGEGLLSISAGMALTCTPRMAGTYPAVYAKGVLDVRSRH